MANEYKKVISEKKNEAKKLMTDDQVTKCNVAIHSASAAAAAEAFIPLPGVDAIPITATQITMVLALGKVFDQKVSDSAAKGIIGAAASTFVGRSLVKLIPIAGWAVSAAIAAGATEAIGWTVAIDFAKQSANRVETKSEETYADHVVETSEIIKDIIKDAPTVSLDDLDDMLDDDVVGFESTISEEDTEKVSETSNDSEEDSDDESISNDFAKAFGEDE